jgi:hypothetical protein
VRIASLALAITACTVACGARTGLDVVAHDRPDAATLPDAGRDAGVDSGVDAAFDAGPTCGPNVTLLPAHADVLLVLDRSGSMTRALASSSTSRWSALHDSLASALPAFDANVAFGATIFPVPDATTTNGLVCRAGASLDVPVALGSGAAILRALEAHAPSGGTPTADAITAAASALRVRRHVGVPQAIVLATDGGPNCTPDDAGQPWFGQAPETCADQGVDPNECLDTMRTLASIDAPLGEGVPTYVIAMDVQESYLVAVLRQMAEHGGRARASGEPYYDVRNPDDLRAAFRDIATRVSSCSFFPDGMVSTDAPMVEVGGVLVPRDDSRHDGWTLGPSGTFDLYGSACDRAMGGGVVVRIVGACH